MTWFPGGRLLAALCLIVAVALAVAGCGPIRPAPAGAPLCNPADGVNVYVDQGAAAPCQLRAGQRYVIQMPRTQGSDANLRVICLNVWHGAEFIVNFGALDYCVMPGAA